MKYLKYLYIAILGLFAAACAEEDPMSLGTLNPKVTISDVTSTSANISVDLSDCGESTHERGCRIVLLDGGNCLDMYWSYDLDERPFKDDQMNKYGIIFSLSELQPSTTYTFYVEILSVLGSSQDITLTSPDFTFTTAQ